MFENERQVLDWYLSKPRPLSQEFLNAIRWEDIASYPLDAQLIPVLQYMRDVEGFTPYYYRQIVHSISGRNQVIREFMEVWRREEMLHAELLAKFLGRISGAWHPPNPISLRWKLTRPVSAVYMNFIGTALVPVHMTWGAINEFSTLCGYEQVATICQHPVLSYILSGIMKEEARHGKFYLNIARLRLMASPLSRTITRKLVDAFWTPVGQGAKTKAETGEVMRTLFSSAQGQALFRKNVTDVIRKLPGFEDFEKTSLVVDGIA